MNPLQLTHHLYQYLIDVFSFCSACVDSNLVVTQMLNDIIKTFASSAFCFPSMNKISQKRPSVCNTLITLTI